MHANKDQESFTSTRLKIKTLNLLNEVKAKNKASTHDDLIYQMLIFFQNNDVNPANFKKPIPEQIAELRDTFVTFFRTFEEKKLLPYVERTDNSLILILEILQNLDLTEIVKSLNSIPKKREENENIINQNISDNSSIKNEFLQYINQLENQKQFNQRGGQSIVEIRSIEYEDIINKMKKLCS